MNIRYGYDSILQTNFILAMNYYDWRKVGVDSRYNKVETILIRRNK